MSAEDVRQRITENIAKVGQMLAGLHDPPYTVRELQVMYDIQANMETAKVLAVATARGHECRIAQRFVVTDPLGQPWRMPKDVAVRLKEGDV